MTQEYSFNLVDKPWLPCVGQDGKVNALSLRQVLTQAHQLQSLVGDSPPETMALHRLLLVILHRVFGPKNTGQWTKLWRNNQFESDELNVYFDEWHHRFDLFDETRPFYQSATLYLGSNWVSVQRLVHHLNAAYPLFNHAECEIKNYLTPPEATRALITSQNFSLCGTSGAFFPRKKTTDKLKQSMFVDGAIARAINFLVYGNSLFETLMLNLVKYPDDTVIVHFEDDAPAWELDDSSGPDRKSLSGYLDYLTWQNRRILFKPTVDIQNNIILEQMRWEPANRIGEQLRDPMQHHLTNKKDAYYPLYFNEGKALWRDSATLFSLQDFTSDKIKPPATFKWLANLASDDVQALEKHTTYQCHALGMSSKSGQATVYFYRDEAMPLPLDYLNKPKLVNKLKDALERTEQIYKGLYFAAQIAGMHIYSTPDEKSDVKAWKKVNRNAKSDINNWVAYTGIERHYWAALESPFQSFIVDLAQKDRETVMVEWFATLRKTALAAFEQAAQYAGTDAKSFKAVERGRSYLYYRLSEVLPKSEQEETAV